MRSILSVVFAFVIFLPLTAQGQEWTAEQQALWAWETACWETRDLESIMACFHDDFVGWGLGAAEPTTKAERRPIFAESFETTEQVSLDLEPLEIKIHGNTAVLVYLATTVTRNKESGVETRSVERWTDVAMREGGRWVYLTDHGTMVEGG